MNQNQLKTLTEEKDTLAIDQVMAHALVQEKAKRAKRATKARGAIGVTEVIGVL